MFSDRRYQSVFFKVFLSFGVSLLLLVLIVQSLIATRSPEPLMLFTNQIRYVSLPPEGSDVGNDCTNSALPCATIQRAVDQAVASDEVRVAGGIYTNLVTRFGLTQTVYIDKSITLSGGYTQSNWTESNPVMHKTILDAQVQGRGLYVTGEEEVVVQGVHIINGNAASLGGGVPSGIDAGGGIYVITATLSLNNSQIYSNTGRVAVSGSRGYGGGMYVVNSMGTAVSNSIFSANKATFGAGLFFKSSPYATLDNNEIIDNIANHVGGGGKHHGGIYLLESPNAKLTNNKILRNIAEDTCAGISLNSSQNIELISNTIMNNIAKWRNGGGICISQSDTVLKQNHVISNTSNQIIAGGGGGLYIYSSDVIMHNNIIAENVTSIGEGSGILAAGSSLDMIHNTLANNHGPDGIGVLLKNLNTVPTIGILSNTIIVSNSVGISTTGTSEAMLNGVLWYENDQNYLGNVTVSNEITGNPHFETAVYHISENSAAQDKGIPTYVFDDIDGDARPFGDAVDLGADEYTTSTVSLLGFQPGEDDGYLFTLRLADMVPSSQYTLTTIHHTDADYPQKSILVMTDAQGYASAQVWSRCKAEDVLFGHVFAQVTGAGMSPLNSNQVDCPGLRLVKDFGTHLVTDTTNDDWIYRTSPPAPNDSVEIWLEDNNNTASLTGTIHIQSADGNYVLPEQPLIDGGNGRYRFAWPISARPAVADYRVQLTLEDDMGNLSGVDGFVKLSGRAMWVWGESQGPENPIIWAIMTNSDYDNNGVGDRDEWLGFHNQPYAGEFDPYVTTSYFNIYPYITFSGTNVTSTIQTFLAETHSAGAYRVEALAGTYEWVESDENLSEGKAFCDAVLEFNRASIIPNERFDGIHFDIEHDSWGSGEHWPRYLELISYCQEQVDTYNETYKAIVFGVDIPPHFLTGIEESGSIKSNWDVMAIVDRVTLMDYRDFADMRGDGRVDGIIPRAEAFMDDGLAWGTGVVIGVELTPNTYNHVTFYEECPKYMERELQQVSREFSTESAYHGLAIHDYAAWKDKVDQCKVFLPIII